MPTWLTPFALRMNRKKQVPAIINRYIPPYEPHQSLQGESVDIHSGQTSPKVYLRAFTSFQLFSRLWLRLSVRMYPLNERELQPCVYVLEWILLLAPAPKWPASTIPGPDAHTKIPIAGEHKYKVRYHITTLHYLHASQMKVTLTLSPSAHNLSGISSLSLTRKPSDKGRDLPRLSL
jgi:hypothetical protein